MGEVFELTYCDLRCKEIVNAVDGKKLGRILDLVFSRKGEIKGIVAPFGRRGLFLRCQEIFIPWRCIKKIGEDIILVEIDESSSHDHKGKRSKDKGHGGGYSEQYRDYYHDNDCDEHDKRKEPHSKQRESCSSHKDYDSHSSYHDKDCPPYKEDCRPPHHDKEHDCRSPHHDRDCPPPNKGHDHKHKGGCDRRCEKCMLFDCIDRWREGIYVDERKYD